MLSVYRDRLLDFIGTRSAFPDDSSSRRTIERYRMSDAGFDRPSVCNNGAGQHSRIFFFLWVCGSVEPIERMRAVWDVSSPERSIDLISTTTLGLEFCFLRENTVLLRKLNFGGWNLYFTTNLDLHLAWRHLSFKSCPKRRMCVRLISLKVCKFQGTCKQGGYEIRSRCVFETSCKHFNLPYVLSSVHNLYMHALWGVELCPNRLQDA